MALIDDLAYEFWGVFLGDVFFMKLKLPSSVASLPVPMVCSLLSHGAAGSCQIQAWWMRWMKPHLTGTIQNGFFFNNRGWEYVIISLWYPYIIPPFFPIEINSFWCLNPHGNNTSMIWAAEQLTFSGSEGLLPLQIRWNLCGSDGFEMVSSSWHMDFKRMLFSSRGKLV